MRRITDPKLIFGFVLIFGVLCVNALVLATNMQTVTRNRESVEHSHEVITAIDSVLDAMQDAETGQRGYLLTDEKEYLKPYNSAVETVGQRLAELQKLTRDNKLLRSQIASLEDLVAAKLAELRDTIRLEQQGRASEAITEVLTAKGFKQMEAIRGRIAQMENSEKRLRARRMEESRASEQKTRATFVAATITSLILLVLVYLIIVRYIDERRRSAEALQKREEWLSTTLRSIGDAVIATDAEGAILFMNNIAQQLTGWTQEDAVGKEGDSVFVIVNETTRETVVSPISQVIQENRIVALANHTVLIARNGAETFIDDSAAPIHDSEGNMTGVVLVFRDIAERKAVQKQRDIHLADLEALNGRLQRAVTETHHRVKNNLQIISSMVSLHSQQGDGTLSAEEVKRLGTNITTLATVQDVLTKASKRDGEINAVSTKELLEKLVTVHQQTALRHTITAELDEIKLPGEQGTALALLASELLSNAIKHGKSAVRLSMDINEGGDILEMTVADDGPGFAEDFDPLQAANTGLELIVSLAKWDLRGELSFRNTSEGGEVQLKMPLR